MEFTGIERAALFFGMISLIFSSVKTTDAGNYYTRTMTTIAREDIVNNVILKSEIACVLSCQQSASCQIPASKYEDINDGGVQGEFECLHIDQTKSSQGEKNIPVMILAVHSLISMSLEF